MMSFPRALGAFAMCLALSCGASPARALTFEAMFVPGLPFGTIFVTEVSSEPGVLSIQVPPGPLGPPVFDPAEIPFIITLINSSPDTIAALDLEIGRANDDIFEPGSDGLVFLTAPSAPILGASATLSNDAAASQLDLSRVFSATASQPSENTPSGLEPDGLVNLDFFIRGDGGSSIDLRLTLNNPVPEPTTLALALMGMGAALRRPLRRV